MKTARSATPEQEESDQFYKPNQELVATIKAMKQEAAQQNVYYREQLEAIFPAR
ncbi:hypothetical protein [Mesobaculum littorinae]|uniref:hypothetical protein n=1 Tax=Mesobaculum littorinae TaxID=2486419 RepID=UPI0013E39049|nr:hypothetical protein [Mesobaculum littorinae]